MKGEIKKTDPGRVGMGPKAVLTGIAGLGRAKCNKYAAARFPPAESPERQILAGEMPKSLTRC